MSQISLANESAFALHTLRADNGLCIRALPGGCIYSIERQEILISQILASPTAGGVHRIYLRVHEGERIRHIEVVGPSANSRFAVAPDRFVWSGVWEALDYQCTCRLHPSGAAWFFHIQVINRGETPLRCDAVLVQDVGLATRGQVRNNELFTSQYLDHFTVDDPQVGRLLMTRQNLPQAVGSIQTNPWLMQGCLPRAAGFATDGIELFGPGFKAQRAPARLSESNIGQQIRQYEMAYTAIQSQPVMLPASDKTDWTFFGYFLADHPDASSGDDARRVADVRAMLDQLKTVSVEVLPPASSKSIFQTATSFRADDLDPTEWEKGFPQPRRHEERDNGRLLSFFCGEDSRHVVLQGKELAVARPHGHIMRSGQGWLPDAPLMCCTCYAAGVFAAQLSMGNATLATLLSRPRDPLNIVCSSGLRIFVRDGKTGAWELLGVPSAFEMSPDECRWYYRRGDDLLTVSCTATSEATGFVIDVRSAGQPVELLISGEISAGPAEYESSPRLTIDRSAAQFTVVPDTNSLLGKTQPQLKFHVVCSTPESIDAMGSDELLFLDGESRRLPYFAVRTRPTTSFKLTFPGSPSANGEPIPAPIRFASESRSDVWALQDTLAWFARDAMIHLSTPRGLEQANGGAWGVRDVCQGSVEFLLALNRLDVVKDILRKVFSQQYHRRGDWPQWFMFPPYQQIQSSHSHGDVVIWPLKALCDYLEESNDATILDEPLPYADVATFEPTTQTQPLLEHVDRAIAAMREQLLPGLSLPRYGEGDWDDSLQPADPSLRERMVSSWTTQLMYQTLSRYAVALEHFGQTDRAASVTQFAAEIRADFQRYLMPGGVVAGFALFDGQSARPTEYLLHPSDQRTGLRYRLIPMSRGMLSGIFSPQQALHHADLIREHLLFPDGARLMDRPTTYTGGCERVFRRSESAACFGREIGLQYVHAHLRYAEAMAMLGRADELWRALLVVNPITVTQRVPSTRARQRNTYFSSSDAAFTDRYQASRDYDQLREGKIPTDGGWRIYSSGPGIYTNLVVRYLLGIRHHFDWIEFDPVLPRELDGVVAERIENGRTLRYRFAVRTDTPGVKRLAVNGVPATSWVKAEHPYRAGAARMQRDAFEHLLTGQTNTIELET